MPIPDENLLDILACPACRGDLKYTAGKTGFVCSACKKKYPIKDGIPRLMVE